MSMSSVDRRLRELAAEEPLTVKISGLCMAPLLRDGAVVRIAPRRAYLPGDVLVFRDADGRLTAHRLIGAYPKRGGLRLMTAADASRNADRAIRPSQVLGRVVAGDCHPTLSVVPLGDRARALGRFVSAAYRRMRELAGARLV